MDAKNEIRLKLRFYRDVTQNIDEIRQKFENYAKSDNRNCSIKMNHNHIWFNIPKNQKEYWSPHLHLELEEKSVSETHIRGLFGPDPTLWTFFMFLHFVIAGIFIIFGMIAYSNYSLKEPYMMDIITMFIMIVIWFLLYVIARQIREKGNVQMNELENEFLSIIEQ